MRVSKDALSDQAERHIEGDWRAVPSPVFASHNTSYASVIGSVVDIRHPHLSFGHWFGHNLFSRPCQGFGGCVQGAKRPAHTPRLPFLGRLVGRIPRLSELLSEHRHHSLLLARCWGIMLGMPRSRDQELARQRSRPATLKPGLVPRGHEKRSPPTGARQEPLCQKRQPGISVAGGQRAALVGPADVSWFSPRGRQ